MSTSEKPVRVSEELSEDPRYCIECGRRLARYNTDNKCFSHPSMSRRAVIGTSSVHNPLRVWTPPLLFPAPKPRAAPATQKPVEPVVPVAAETPPQEEIYKPPGERIFDEGCKFFMQSKKDIIGPSRTRSLSHPRQVLMYLLKHDTKLSTPAIGDMFSRDHSTVLHAIDKIDRLRKTDAQLGRDIVLLRSRYQKPPT